MIRFTLNGQPASLEIEEDTPLLWAIRDNLKLTGTKFGCGIGQCGACTVHLDSKPVRSCLLPVSVIAGKRVTTIEGINDTHPDLHPVQQAWTEINVPQCGYCQSGQIMSAIALLEHNPNPSDADIVEAMDGNLCRCGMYGRIRKALRRAVDLMALRRDPHRSGIRPFDPEEIKVEQPS